MKILIIGFFAFSTWSTMATYIYVCKIKGLCDEQMTMPFIASNHDDVITVDTLHKTLMQERVLTPNNLNIYFAFDKFEFNSTAETDRYFDMSNAYLTQNLQARLSITGFTDAIGSDEYNQALGYQRAQRIQHYFESKGICLLIDSSNDIRVSVRTIPGIVWILSVSIILRCSLSLVYTLINNE